MGRKLVGATGNAGLGPLMLTTSFPPIHLVYGFSSIPAPTDLSDESDLSDLSDKKAGADPLKWEKNPNNDHLFTKHHPSLNNS
jgi:hypothetical protein